MAVKGSYNDVIQIKSNINDGEIKDFNSLLNVTTNNSDGWALIDLGQNNTITIHGISKDNLSQNNFQFY